jgi:hypothetical protein
VGNLEGRVRVLLDRGLARLGEAWTAAGRLDRTDVGRLAVAGTLALIVILSAAWRIGAGLLAPVDDRGTVEAAAADTPAPVVSGLAPKQRIRPRADVQPVEIRGRHFASGMTLTITMPDARIATYGPEALTNVKPASLTLRAIFDMPGTYHLAFRTRTGTRSNDVPVVVGR